MKNFLCLILGGCFLLAMAACSGADGTDSDGGDAGADCGTDCDGGEGDSDCDAGQDGCRLGCDGNIDDSVFVIVVDDSTGEEVCCPTQVLINSRVSTDGGTGLGHDDCICTWREDNRKAFFVATENELNLLEMNLIRVEMDGYLPWEEEIYVPCVCVPKIERTVRLTPEQ